MVAHFPRMKSILLTMAFTTENEGLTPFLTSSPSRLCDPQVHPGIPVLGRDFALEFLFIRDICPTIVLARFFSFFIRIGPSWKVSLTIELEEISPSLVLS